jgi:hypothetical protein
VPFTPLHFGPGLALKGVTGKWFSFMLFCFAQVLIDLEPAWYMLAGDDYIHRFLHTYLGATLAAGVALVAGKAPCEWALRRWNANLSPAQARWLGVPAGITWRAAATGAFAGAWSHVLLDSFMHSDMHPLAPWREDNALLYQVHVDSLYLSCALAGVAGLGLFFWQRWRALRARGSA